MATRAVGLDVGTSAVRAVELAIGRDQATMTRFGQVALPAGAVRDGEVADPPAVASAIRRLWREAGFRARQVIVGVGNQRVVVRQAELPEMSDEDLRSALQFQAEDLIPIPIEEAVVDFQILERYTGSEQEALMRILLVAAQRDMVRSLLAAVQGGGLTATLVDLIPFALMRSLTTASLVDDLEATSQAIVCVGASVTNVVVHQRGVPQFVRMLVVGGDDVTQGIASELGVDLDTAEDLKRRADPASGDELEARTAQIVADRAALIIEEIRGSLDYYQAQPEGAQISRVILTGGGSRTQGLADGLRETLGIPIEPGRPLLGVRVGRIGIPEARLSEAEPLLAVPIGLALAARPPETGMRRLTLMPMEVAVVRAQRRQNAIAAAAVAALATVLGLVWVARQNQVSSERDRANRAQTQAAVVRRQVAGLQPVSNLDTQLAQRRRLVTQALSDDVAWTRLLGEIATVIPNDVWLTGFTGQKAGAPGAAATSVPGAAGNINVTAQGFDHSSAARWLLRVSDLRSLTGLWLPSSTRAGATGLVTFTSTADLTASARSGADRLNHYLGTG
jgi:type IV pilus assembly protein PilM